MAFARAGHEAAVVEYRRGVVQVGITIHRADDDRHAAGVRSQRAGAFHGALDEPGLEEEVLGRITRDAHLGECQQVHAQVTGATEGLDDPGDVAVEIPDGGIDLGETDPQRAHERSLWRAARGLATRWTHA